MHNVLGELRSALSAPNSSELVVEIISPLQPYDFSQLLLELEPKEQVQFIEVLPLDTAVGSAGVSGAGCAVSAFAPCQ